MKNEINNSIISCPKCGNQFEISEAIAGDLEKRYEAQYRKKLTDSLNNLQQREKQLLQREAEIQKNSENIENLVSQRIKPELAKLEKKVKESQRLELEQMGQELEEKRMELQKTKRLELDLRKKEQELKEQKDEMELTIVKRLNAERDHLVKKALERNELDYQMKLREKDELIKGMQDKLEEAKKKGETISGRDRGEAQELLLEEFLRKSFQRDTVEPVAKGESGADIIQTVFNNSGIACGTILWESKRTKNWAKDWIQKLKTDRGNKKADFAVIVSQVLPKEIQTLGRIDDIWVIDYSAVFGLATALRESLLQLNMMKITQEGKEEKKELLYEYICSNEFKTRVEMIVEAFADMKKDLDAERKAFEKQWEKRTKQIEKAWTGTARMFGGLQGLIGKSLGEIRLLQVGEE